MTPAENGIQVYSIITIRRGSSGKPGIVFPENPENQEEHKKRATT
jgi:hypothetical protein